MPTLPDKIASYKKFISFILKYWNSSILQQTTANALETAEEEEGKSDAEHKYSPDELVNDLKGMGSTFVKLGQLLSTRPDLLPDAYLEALRTLQDDVGPIPYEEVHQIVEEEIGTRISKAFRNFDKEPLASASIGQVHRATLQSGMEVAVKIQRPGIRKQFFGDLNTLKELTDFGVKHSETAKKYAVDAVLDELRHILLQELDYTKEAENLRKLGNNLSEFPNLMVPQPVADYSSSKVLTMTYIDGQKATSISPIKLLENDLYPLVDELVEAYLQQIIVDGFVHADPHPGNIQLTRDNKIALIDLGMVARFSPKMQEILLQLLLAMSKKDGDAITDVLLAISETGEESNTEAFRKTITRLAMESENKTAEHMQTGRQLIQMNRVAAENGIHISVELNILGKILLNLDQIVVLLAPKFQLQKAIEKHAHKMMQSKTFQELKPENFFSMLLATKKLTENLPERLNKLSENLANNDFKINIDAIDEKRFTDGFQKVANRITLGLIIAAMILGAAMLMQVPTSFTIFGYPGLAIILFLAAAIAGILLSYNILIRDENFRKRK